MLLNDECRCQSPDCDKKESCLRYIERNNGGVRTPSMSQMCFGDEKFFYRSVNESKTIAHNTDDN